MDNVSETPRRSTLVLQNPVFTEEVLSKSANAKTICRKIQFSDTSSPIEMTDTVAYNLISVNSNKLTENQMDTLQSRSTKRLLRKNVNFQVATVPCNKISRRGTPYRKSKELTASPQINEKKSNNQTKDEPNQVKLQLEAKSKPLIQLSNALEKSQKCHGSQEEAQRVSRCKKRAINSTPNFKAIHKKNFEKMESIDEYYKRVQASHKKNTLKKNEAKKKEKKIVTSKIPKFVLPPRMFVPAVISPSKMQFDFAQAAFSKSKKTNQTLNKIADTKANKVMYFSAGESSKKENQPRQKFDLKASLKRRLNYKPHTGAVMPLVDSSNDGKRKELINKERTNTKEMLKGIRQNRRFKLLMEHRK